MGLSAPTGRHSILLVDNNVFARNLLIRELSREGHFILAACNTEEALRLSAHFRNRIPLLITNSNLPEREALIARILKDHPDIRVLMISAATQAELLKPSVKSSLPDEVRRTINRALTDSTFPAGSPEL